MSTVKRCFGKVEPYYFFGFVLLNILPVLLTDFFPSVDGPSHLYNSKLISELWINPNGPVSEYLKFNEYLNPNWTGHFLLSILLLFISPLWAEKLILLSYLVGLPLGLRFVFNAAQVQSKSIIYLVFPFTYSFLFHFGFYNFNIGVVLFFFGLGLWLKSIEHSSVFRLFFLALVSSLISLSHPFVFLLFLLTVLAVDQTSIFEIISSGRQQRRSQLRRLLSRLVVLIPGLLITISFLLTNDSLQTSTTSLGLKNLLISLKYLMPIKGINEAAYDLISRVMLYLFCILTLIASSRFLINFMKTKTWDWKVWNWMSTALLFLVLLVLVPDYFGTAGLISARLMWFFFIVLIVWFASTRFSKWIVLSVFMLANGVAVWSMYHNCKSISQSARIAIQLADASVFIEQYSTVLPITRRQSKPFVHVTNYLGVRKPIILLHNYEAALSYFPLSWKYENIAPQQMGSMKPNSCLPWIAGQKVEAAVQIDYICVVVEPGVNRNSECDAELNSNLTEYYELIFSNSDDSIKLYRSLMKSKTAPTSIP